MADAEVAAAAAAAAPASGTTSALSLAGGVTPASGTLHFMLTVGLLKKQKRTGWVKRDIEQPESVSDHMHRMGVLSLLFSGDDKVQYEHCVKMAIVHDLAESLVGDITPHCGVPDDEKERLEREAMHRIRDMLPGNPAGEEIVSLWEEYEAQATPESHLVKDLDKFEMILQAFEYERDQQRHPDLEEFHTSVQGKIKHPKVQQWCEELMVLRATLSVQTTETGAPNQ